MLKISRLVLILTALVFMPGAADAAADAQTQTSGTSSAAAQNAASISDPKAIETAQPANANVTPSRELMVRAEVLLDRAHFSPGEIDGKSGDNLNAAIAAYRQSH